MLHINFSKGGSSRKLFRRWLPFRLIALIAVAGLHLRLGGLLYVPHKRHALIVALRDATLRIAQDLALLAFGRHQLTLAGSFNRFFGRAMFRSSLFSWHNFLHSS